ncbi:MAG: OmpA family protein [Pseudomonadales bacterium]
MRWPASTVALWLALSAAAGAATDEDCERGARYFELSERAAADYRLEDRYQFLDRAVAACADYRYWQTLGEVATEFGESDRNQRAADAFVSAYELAETPQQQARSIGRYAELLFHSNQRQRALRYAYEARNLDPESAWIAALAEQVSAAAEQMTEEDVLRGLSDMALKPLKLRTVAVDSPGAGARGSAPADARTINIPLTFEYDSTRLEAGSESNVDVLARTLASRYPDSEILFVGHSDTRGSSDYNMRLSLERARAVYQAVVEDEPTLRERISVVGRGEAEPLSNGSRQLDHRANRRLQVIVR